MNTYSFIWANHQKHIYINSMSEKEAKSIFKQKTNLKRLPFNLQIINISTLKFIQQHI